MKVFILLIIINDEQKVVVRNLGVYASQEEAVVARNQVLTAPQVVKRFGIRGEDDFEIEECEVGSFIVRNGYRIIGD